MVLGPYQNYRRYRKRVICGFMSTVYCIWIDEILAIGFAKVGLWGHDVLPRLPYSSPYLKSAVPCHMLTCLPKICYRTLDDKSI